MAASASLPFCNLSIRTYMDYRYFAHTLLSDAMFYDPEYGVVGSVSLVDPVDRPLRRERFIAGFDPTEEIYLIEEATEWDEASDDEDEDVGYLFAADGMVAHRFETSEEAADMLLDIAAREGLVPTFMPLFEEEEG